MPRKPKIACSHKGCPTLVEPGNHGLCDEHKTERNRRYATIRTDSEHTRIYKTKGWQRARKEALYRDGGWCVICKEAPASLVDHIVEIKDGGKPYALGNLQSLCNKCHSKKTRDAAIMRSKGEVYGT